MASFTLTRPDVFPNGTTVKAYPKSNWPTTNIPSGAPVGAAANEQTMTSGTLTFAELTEGVEYWAVAEVGGVYRYVGFLVPTASGSAVTVEGQLPAGTHNIGDVDVVTLPELPAGTKNIGQVDPRGNVAHGAADSGNPVKVGARARTELPTAVTQDQRTDNISDKFGRQLATVAPLDARVSGTLNLTNTESKEVIAGVENFAIVVTAISVTNASASVSTKVEIFDEATAKWKGYAVKEGGGFVVSDPNGLWVGTKSKPVKAKCVTTSSDTDISISGYKVPA